MSFRLRLMISISVLIAIAFGIGGGILISASFDSSLKKETSAALDSFDTVRTTLYLLNSLGGKTDYDSLSDALGQISGRSSARWAALTLTSGEKVLYQKNPELLDAGLSMPEPGQYAYTIVRDARGYGLQILGSISAGAQQLALKMRFDLSAVYETRSNELRLYMTIYLAVVLLSICISGALAYVLTRRLDRLASAARRIAGGDLESRSGIRSRDEFGQLSRDFDAMADQLQKSIHDLEAQMQRQEAFMGAFAHELKTPMTSIIGYADLLRQDGLDDNTRTLAAGYIFSEGQRLEKLSHKLLELILLRQETIEGKSVFLPALLTELEHALSPALRGQGIRLICRSDPGYAVLDPDLIKSLLYNLVDNAAKAMDQGGIIAVKATSLPEGCQFQVVDNGRGMEASELSKITEAFYRVDKSRSRSQGGAGLGLALCQQIVQLHHGSIRFISAPGTGTRVTVTLPEKGEDSHA